ncbi:MAG: bifunctional diguanylate cyclase/phosphodiesterase [Oscillospiraceae bacterium]|nr:bifunctional diguanylate cyclase/phosphodiesterase [Oscillospiraceae bacterium]
MERYVFTPDQQTLLEKMQVPFAVYQFLDRRVVTLVLSDGFCELFGYEDRAQACHDMDHDMYRNTHPDDAARVADAALRFATEGGIYETVYRTRIKGGEEYHMVHAMGKHVYTDSGVRLAQIWYFDEGLHADGSAADGPGLKKTLDSVLREESARGAIRYDYLTGLPNMTYFFEMAEIGKDAIEKAGGEAALLFIDLSGMKFFNTKYGFAEGDKLLQAFARLLSATFHNENCCRIGSDHFAVFTEERDLEQVLGRLFRDSRSINEGRSLPVRVGIFPSRLEAVPASVACDRAKLACDAQRNTYQSCFRYYDSGLREDAELRQYILSNLDRALEEEWIQVYYQPIVRAMNGKVCDEEALARWVDPVKGFLSPADFIPVLEDAGVIHRLDLYVVEKVLEKLRIQEVAGLFPVPQSVNLSRSDFDMCDIVEEIRKLVDGAGVRRDLITIEVTESTIGKDFDFMKERIERFQQLGFAVWMDDFGSGYSSLDVLQGIHFNTIKFDMSFMRQLDRVGSGKIVLTELMKMATALGVDTVCEGVETEKQVHFLQEIGCSKLQGYYYARPMSMEKVFERYEKGIQIGFENPGEAGYYETIGRVNLYDLAVIVGENENDFQNYFNTLPMGIMEVRDGTVEFVRSNRSYRSFLKRFFDYDLTEADADFKYMPFGSGSSFMTCVKQCCHSGNRAFLNEQMPDGSTVHSFVRRIAVNPVTGKTAIVVAVLSITEAGEGTAYAGIARALAADYYNIYFVDLETEHFIEYRAPLGGKELAMERHGEDFFAASIQDTQVRIFEADREPFLKVFTKENVLRTLDEEGSFTVSYRLIDTGSPMRVRLRATRMNSDDKHLIIGISIADSGQD